MKVLSVVGARPQFIKEYAISRHIKKTWEYIVVHTGQHYDYEMSQIFFSELDLSPVKYNLEVGSGPHGQQTAQMMIKLEKILLEEKPDAVLVYGDTNSTLAGALSASKLHIPIGHVEAGLRSFDRSMPEETNRVLVDHCSTLLFCPTDTARTNLQHEGIIKGVFLTGDVMVDALQHNLKLAKQSKILSQLTLTKKQYLLVTLHRAGNTDNTDNLSSIVDALCSTDEPVVLPLHPRTEKCLKSCNLYKKLASHVLIIKPLGYLDFIQLCAHSRMILTDSGGIQKEAYILKVPCVTMRENTEWVETVDDGWNILVGSETKKIREAIKTFQPASSQRDVFGKGNASEAIIHELSSSLTL